MGAFEGTLTAKQVTIEPETRAENEYFEIQCTYHDDQTTLSVPFGNLFVAGARVTLTDTLVLDAAKHPWPHPAWTNTTCERVLWVRYNANAERYEISGENSMVDTAVTRDKAIARAHSFMATNPTVSAML